MITGKIEVHTAVVDVPDRAVDTLSGMFKPKKTIYAKVTYADIAGLDGSAGKTGHHRQPAQSARRHGWLHSCWCAALRTRMCPIRRVASIRSGILPTMEGEFIINDLVATERKLERLNDEKRKGGRDKAAVEREIALFDRLHAALSEEKPLRELGLTADEVKTISGFGMLSLKPMLIVLTLAEGHTAPEIKIDKEHIQVVSLQGKLEMDIAQLPAEDAAMFLEEYGITEPSLNRMIAFPTTCSACNPSSLSAPTKCAHGPCAAAPWPPRQRA